MNQKNKEKTLTLAAHQESASTEAETLAAVVQELQRLTKEAKNLSRDARVALECKWFIQHTEIFPRLCRWKEDILAKTYSTFDVGTQQLIFKPLLSDADSPPFPEPIQLAESTSPLDENYSPCTTEFLRLALGGREMQLDFQHKMILVPLVLFERTCGIFIASVPDLVPARYEAITSATSAMLNRVRDIAIMQSLRQQAVLESAS